MLTRGSSSTMVPTPWPSAIIASPAAWPMLTGKVGKRGKKGQCDSRDKTAGHERDIVM
jgi:hypothetical protein